MQIIALKSSSTCSSSSASSSLSSYPLLHSSFLFSSVSSLICAPSHFSLSAPIPTSAPPLSSIFIYIPHNAFLYSSSGGYCMCSSIHIYFVHEKVAGVSEPIHVFAVGG